MQEKTGIIIKYDTPIEVTKSQYNTLMNKFSGVVCGLEDNGKYYIKVWLMQYAHLIENFLQSKPDETSVTNS